MTQPTKKLFDPNTETRFQWTDHTATDIRARFNAIREAQAQVASKNVRQLKQKGKTDESLIPLLQASIEEARARKGRI